MSISKQAAADLDALGRRLARKLGPDVGEGKLHALAQREAAALGYLGGRTMSNPTPTVIAAYHDEGRQMRLEQKAAGRARTERRARMSRDYQRRTKGQNDVTTPISDQPATDTNSLVLINEAEEVAARLDTLSAMKADIEAEDRRLRDHLRDLLAASGQRRVGRYVLKAGPVRVSYDAKAWEQTMRDYPELSAQLRACVDPTVNRARADKLREDYAPGSDYRRAIDFCRDEQQGDSYVSADPTHKIRIDVA